MLMVACGEAGELLNARPGGSDRDVSQVGSHDALSLNVTRSAHPSRFNLLKACLLCVLFNIPYALQIRC